MKSLNPKKTLALLISSCLAFASPAFSQTVLVLDNERRFQDEELSVDGVKVLVNYDPVDFDSGNAFGDNNLEYRLFYEGVAKLKDEAFTLYTGSVSLQDLNNDDTAEVIVKTYSGGAHCCTNFQIYSWQGEQFTRTETGPRDGGGGAFKDLDQDGVFEFITYDNSFLYAFSSYASSFPPTSILQFKNGEFIDVTRQYPQLLEDTAWEMYQAFLNNSYEVNGILAGYVAQKILLREFEEGWNFMLANYDRSSDWGLDIYEGNEVVGQYPDFPTALKAFLIETGYLDLNGQLIEK
ncbi:MAG: hypothetical protein ACOC0N_06440 [Chroococcales cyanobacterium]